jgi:ferric-dicitrate binding protein FerR (iron transport regulator)
MIAPIGALRAVESNMRFTINKMPINLSAETPINLEEPDGTTLRVLRGRVWVTQEGSVDDVFLDAGSGYTFRADGKVIISVEGAVGAAATILFDAPLAVAGRATLAATIKRLLTWHPAPLSTASNAYDGI